MRLALIAVVASLALVAVPAEARTVSYAIVIGNNAPPVDTAGEQLSPLRYADDDAVRYFQLLSRIGQARLLAVLDRATQQRYVGLAAVAEPPTLRNLRQIVASYAVAMAADKQRGDAPVLYIAFSGHGARAVSGEPFLALLDGALTEHVLYDEILAALPATYSHLLIDACHAGGVVGIRGDFFDKQVDGQSRPITSDEIASVTGTRRIAQFPNVGVIVATSLGEEAHEWSQIEAGVFSHELISALLGPGDVNADGNIEYTEVQAFIAAANRNIKDPKAIPHVIARPPSANHNAPVIALSMVSGGGALTGAIDKLGRFHIELDNGQRYLDAHLASGSRINIVMPPGSNAYVRTENHEARIPAGARLSVEQLQLVNRSVASRGSIDSSYRAALFTTEFGKDYYRGYVDSIGAVGVRFAEPVAVRAVTDGAPRRRDREPAIIALSVAGLSAVTSVTTAVLALRAKRDYEDTDLQRPAHAAKQRFERYRMFSITSGAVALGTGALAWWLWPSSSTRVAPAVSSDGATVTVELSW
ncbi:MAG: caspase family protein [Kofleriaceae bacterium]